MSAARNGREAALGSHQPPAPDSSDAAAGGSWHHAGFDSEDSEDSVDSVDSENKDDSEDIEGNEDNEDSEDTKYSKED